MQLNRIEIKNFRSIKDQKITLPRNFNIFVGINESGKSNILKAASLLDPNAKITKEDIRDPIYDESPVKESYVRFVFNVDNNVLSEILKKLNNVLINLNAEQHIVADAQSQYSVESFIRRYRNQYLYIVNTFENKRYLSTWAMDESKFNIVEGWKTVKSGVKPMTIVVDGKQIKLIEGMIVNLKQLGEHSLTDVLTDLTTQYFLSILNKTLKEVGSTNLPNCIQWSYSESILLPDRIDLNQFILNTDICVPLKNMFLLSGYSDVSNALKEAISKKNGITNILRRVSDLTTNHMKSVWPEWKGIKVTLKENGNNIDAFIEDVYNVFSVNRRSDGFKRFFTFLLMISAQSRTNQIHDNIIIIDEPEIGLHPKGTEFLRNELCQIGKTNIILVSTHSIFMVDKEITDRHIIVEKIDEITQLKRVESSNVTDEEVVFRALGYSVFELLRKKNIIFEGWRDKAIFKKYCTDSKIKKTIDYKTFESVGLLHALGAKDIERIASMCENFDRDYVILSDADKPAKEKKKRFKGKGVWLTFDELIKNNKSLTTEDFISNELINGCLIELCNKYGIKESLALPDDCVNRKVEYMQNELAKMSSLTIDKDIFLDQVKELITDKVTQTDLSDEYLEVVNGVLEKC